jgi:thiamine kinase-like enzyme
MNLEEDRLRLALEEFLSKTRGGNVAVTGWKRETSPVAVQGVFPIEVLHVRLRGGEQVSLFVKHLGEEQANHPDKQCRDREPRIYQELLGGDGLPVPRYYGSRWNQATKRHELYLEYIADWSLKYQDLDTWFPAARDLARFHAHFAGRATELWACEYLLHLDAPYFQRWAQRALDAVAEQEAELADDLRPLVDGYGRVAETLGEQPVTFVHNDLAPKNVLADRSQHPARICFVDWEMAGAGCGLLDLVHLKHGLASASDRAMCAAYCEALKGSGLLPSGEQALRRLFAACELHQTLVRLAHSGSWDLPPGRLAQWVADARNLAGQA